MQERQAMEELNMAFYKACSGCIGRDFVNSQFALGLFENSMHVVSPRTIHMLFFNTALINARIPRYKCQILDKET
jgi:hypothetical protein